MGAIGSRPLPHRGEGGALGERSEPSKPGWGEPHTGTGLFTPHPSSANVSPELRYPPRNGGG